MGAMSAWLKPAAAVLAALIAFGAGCRYSAAQADAEISALKEDYATRARALEEKYRESEALANAKLRAAWEERDIALAHASDLSADLERVRKQAADARSRLSASAGGTCDAERKQLARCADLLERGTELVRRGVELSERTAIDKDAIAMIVSR